MRRSESAATANKLQPEPRIEFTTVVGAATGKTCYCAFDSPHTMEIALAMRTSVPVSPGAFDRREREIVAALFIRDSQIAASLPPLGAMGQDAAPTGAKLSKNMGQFMAERAIDFGWMLKQPRI